MRSRARWILTPCAAPRHSFAGGTNSLPFPPERKRATRTIESIGIERCGEEVRLTYTGDGFLYNMVRILTGTLLEVGLGERRPDDMEAILASHSRASAGFTAPAQGLFLWDVTY